MQGKIIPLEGKTEQSNYLLELNKLISAQRDKQSNGSSVKPNIMSIKFNNKTVFSGPSNSKFIQILSLEFFTQAMLSTLLNFVVLSARDGKLLYKLIGFSILLVIIDIEGYEKDLCKYGINLPSPKMLKTPRP